MSENEKKYTAEEIARATLAKVKDIYENSSLKKYMDFKKEEESEIEKAANCILGDENVDDVMNKLSHDKRKRVLSKLKEKDAAKAEACSNWMEKCGEMKTMNKNESLHSFLAKREEKIQKKRGVPEDANPETHERCVEHVKDQGKNKASAYAICNAAKAGMKKKEQMPDKDRDVAVDKKHNKKMNMKGSKKIDNSQNDVETNRTKTPDSKINKNEELEKARFEEGESDPVKWKNRYGRNRYNTDGKGRKVGNMKARRALQEKGVHQKDQRNPRTSDEGSEAGNKLRAGHLNSDLGRDPKSLHLKNLKEQRKMKKPNLPKSEDGIDLKNRKIEKMLGTEDKASSEPKTSLGPKDSVPSSEGSQQMKQAKQGYKMPKQKVSNQGY